MEYEFMFVFAIILLGAPLLAFIILMAKVSSMSSTLDSVSYELSTVRDILEKMKKENFSQPDKATENKTSEQLNESKKLRTDTEIQYTEAPKEIAETLQDTNVPWWQKPLASESGFTEKTVETAPKVEEKQPESIRTVDTTEVEETAKAEETIEETVTLNEDIRPATVEIPIMETEDKPSEVEEETPETVEEPITEQEKEPATAMEEELEEETGTEYTPEETNFEKYIGENLFGKIGILIFIIGIGFFVKYAIDQNWINETARTILGYTVGAGMLVLAERLHKRYHTFSSLLAGGAFGIFYLITAIAFHYYTLFSQTTAFVILCATTVFMSGVSVLYDRKELAVTALVGGFIAPFIVSTDSSSIITLQTYISILNIGMFGLAMYKKWGILPIISFGFTYLILWGSTVASSFTVTEAATIHTELLGFSTLFYIIFLLPVVFILRTQCSSNMRGALLSVITANNFMYLLYGNYVLQECATTFAKGGLVAFFIAVINLSIYLYLRFRVEGQDTLRNFMLALAITFATLGIPMQFDTDNNLMLWTAEAILLLWLFTKEKNRIYEFGSAILSFLSIAALAYYRTTFIFIDTSGDTLFFNENFFVTMFVSIACFITAIILQYNKELFSQPKRLISYSPCNAIAYMLGFSILYLALWDDFHAHIEQPTATYASLLAFNVMFLGGALLLRKRFAISKYRTAYDISLYITAGAYAVAVWNQNTPDGLMLRWLTTIVTIAYLAYSMRGLLIATLKQNSTDDGEHSYNLRELLFATPANKGEQTVYAIISTLVWLTATRLLMITFGVTSFTTAFSLSLGIAAFLLMCIGMRYHSKQLRLVSLAEFGIIIGKLVINDVWAMPALGKILVFISLGATLLILSFLYQKLKDALFNEDGKEAE